MENKYYQPELEELILGMDLEIETMLGRKVGCFPDILLLNEELNQFKDYFSKAAHADLYVKYLDKEDIESCNWIYTGRSVDIWFQKEGEFEMSSWTAYKVIMHYGLHDQRLHVYADDPGSPDYTLFRGIVKNKSEFQKVMKMINITQ